jgi:peptidoglycan/LPS O-acetylase OafA/YrhL
MIPGHDRRGSFDTLRLVAALTVFHSHSFALAGRYEPQVAGYHLGSVAVIVFFAMSGYWVGRSALQRSPQSFALARTLRIVPGLFVCCLLTIALCALATSYPINSYFGRADTWLWLQNAFPLVAPQRPMLPGVFLDGPYHHANGSLWTLPHEVFCYVMAALAAIFGPKGMRAAMAVSAVFLGVVMFTTNALTEFHLPTALNAQWLALYLAAFFYGAVLNDVGDRTLVKLVTTAALALLIARHEPLGAKLAGLALYSAAAIWLGRNLDLDRRVTRGWDISYGIYIYAWPCQQLAARALAPQSAPQFALYYAVALGACLLLALLSWMLVERPALNAKASLAGVVERSAKARPLQSLPTTPSN